MKCSGCSEYTVDFVYDAMKFLCKYADLNDAEAAK
jgi:hypothetical protein